MGTSNKYLAPLVPDSFYHVYNRTNNKETLFLDEEDHHRFLNAYAFYISPVAQTYAYCLLPNHFHFLIKVRPLEDVLSYLRNGNEPAATRPQKRILTQLISNNSVCYALQIQFLRLFTSYSMFFNRKWNRKGNLFYRRFKRLPIQSGAHLSRLIFYIHANPQKHGVEEDFLSYNWSSYHGLLLPNHHFLENKAVMEWFGGRSEFILFHKESAIPPLMKEWEDEEEKKQGHLLEQTLILP